METHFTILEHIGTYTTSSNNEFNLTRNLHGNVELLQLHFTLQTSSDLKYQRGAREWPRWSLMIPDDPWWSLPGCFFGSRWCCSLEQHGAWPCTSLPQARSTSEVTRPLGSSRLLDIARNHWKCVAVCLMHIYHILSWLWLEYRLCINAISCNADQYIQIYSICNSNVSFGFVVQHQVQEAGDVRAHLHITSMGNTHSIPFPERLSLEDSFGELFYRTRSCMVLPSREWSECLRHWYSNVLPERSTQLILFTLEYIGQ